MKHRLDEEIGQDPRWKNRSDLARNIIWEWLKDQKAQTGGH